MCILVSPKIWNESQGCTHCTLGRDGEQQPVVWRWLDLGSDPALPSVCSLCDCGQISLPLTGLVTSLVK